MLRTTKVCNRCQQTKPLRAFAKAIASADGFAWNCRQCMFERHRERMDADPLHQRKQHLRTRHGITLEEFEEMLAQQGGGCAICGGTPGARSFHVDHDHGCCTGNNSCAKCRRGILCDSCNRGLGYYQDNPRLLELAADYLRTFEKNFADGEE